MHGPWISCNYAVQRHFTPSNIIYRHMDTQLTNSRLRLNDWESTYLQNTLTTRRDMAKAKTPVSIIPISEGPSTYVSTSCSRSLIHVFYSQEN